MQRLRNYQFLLYPGNTAASPLTGSYRVPLNRYS